MVRYLLLLAWLLLPATAVCNNGTTAPVWQTPNDDDLRMLEVRLDQYVMDDIVLAYEQAHGLLLPLGMLGEILGIAITTSPDNGTASGFIIDPTRRFFLDVGRGNVTIAGKKQTFDRARVTVYPDDIYVEKRLLEDWLPLTLDIDLYALQLLVHPTEPLPMQQRMAREKRITRARGQLAPKQPQLPRFDTPYTLWSPPFIDQSYELGWRHDANGEQGRYRYAIHATGDLLYMQSSLHLAGDSNDAFQDARLTLGRTDPDGKLLGPLGATRFLVGHVGFPAIPLVTSASKPATGINIDSFPLYRQSFYDHHDFEGELPDGWDVELYRNNVLIDYQPSAVDGRYHFADVPLLLGHNFFQLIFHGPKGERREQRHHFILGNAMTRPGEQHYRLVANKADDGQDQMLLRYDLGLMQRLSARLAVASLPVTGGNELFYSAALHGFGEGFYSGLNLTRSGNGLAAQLSAQWRLGPLNFTGQKTELDNFSSPAFETNGAALRSRDTLRIDSTVPLRSGSPLNFGIGARRDVTVDGHVSLQIDQRLAAHFHRLLISNTLSQFSDGTTSLRRSGELTFSGRMARTGFRGQLQYGVTPQSKIERLAANVELGTFRGFGVNLHFDHSTEDNPSRLRLELRKLTGSHLLSLGAEVNDEGSWYLSLNWRSSAGRSPSGNDWFFSSRSLANSGMVTARAFLDRDLDNIWDENEEALSGVRFAIGPEKRVLPEATDDTGTVLLDRLPPYQPEDISVAEFSLEDPLWMPATAGWSVTPRPGRPVDLQFAIVPTGEIDGTIYLQAENGRKPVGQVIIEAVTKDGRIAARTQSAFDGFYVLSRLPLGRYQVRIAPAQLEELQLVADLAKEVLLDNDNPFFSGANFQLSRPDNTKKTTRGGCQR